MKEIVIHLPRGYRLPDGTELEKARSVIQIWDHWEPVRYRVLEGGRTIGKIKDGGYSTYKSARNRVMKR